MTANRNYAGINLVPIFLLFAFIPIMLGMFAGCGNNAWQSGSSMTLPEFGISADVPEGWKLDANYMCTKDDYSGLLLSEPLEGKTFSETAESMSTEFGGKIISKKELKIQGKTALQIISETQDMKVIRLYLDFGKSIVYLSYAVLKTDFPTYEPSFLKSFDSLKIKE